GKWLNDQDLDWTLVTAAQHRIRELENEWGCFFDRNPDGTVHQKAFAGQSFDRTVHKGDLTGIEIMNRLAEQVWARGIGRLEEHRALALIKSADGAGIAGALLLDIRSGAFVLVEARAVLLATGGGPTMYRYHTPSGDKSCDGMAMALRLGLPLRDMEMVQFHPTGLMAGAGTRITGTIIEEGLRGVGGRLLDGSRRRFMPDYDPRAERATRDVVSRAMVEQMRAGRVGPNGGVFLTMRHLDPGMVRANFKGMVERCADVGFDLVSGLVEVTPTAHYMIGGVRFNLDCTTELPGLFAAGEDAGGVHGANRLGGNGVANSTVFGGIAGAAMAAWLKSGAVRRSPDMAAVEAAEAEASAPLSGGADSLEPVRDRLYAVMWDDAGVIRDQAGLARASQRLDELDAELDRARVPVGSRQFNMAWQDWLNLKNLVLVSRAVVAAATVRRDSCGAHYRADFPAEADSKSAAFTEARMAGREIRIDRVPVAFTRVKPGETLLKGAA
ncbi:MAG: L-aspartate oxidase, partial [Rhodospirillales bacterium]